MAGEIIRYLRHETLGMMGIRLVMAARRPSSWRALSRLPTPDEPDVTRSTPSPGQGDGEDEDEGEGEGEGSLPTAEGGVFTRAARPHPDGWREASSRVAVARRAVSGRRAVNGPAA